MVQASKALANGHVVTREKGLGGRTTLPRGLIEQRGQVLLELVETKSLTITVQAVELGRTHGAPPGSATAAYWARSRTMTSPTE